MQDETALYGAKMMQPVMTPADNEENNLRPQHLEDYIGQEKAKQTRRQRCRKVFSCTFLKIKCMGDRI